MGVSRQNNNVLLSLIKKSLFPAEKAWIVSKNDSVYTSISQFQDCFRSLPEDENCDKL